MSVWSLVWQEIRHRKLNFSLAMLSVIVAVAALVGAVTLLEVHDRHTEAALAIKQQQVDERTKQLEDEMRKITKNMGFNVAILPADQNLSDLFADDYASKYMPEEYAEKLAASPIVTINHILPSLEQRVRWPERNDRTIIVIGIRGQIPVAHDPKKPIMEAVPPGGIVLGSEIAATEQLKIDDDVTLMGRTFKVSKINLPRGDKQDITVWIDLKAAQEMFDKAGLVNAIWALECECAFSDLPKVRAEIAQYLPNTQVIEKGTIALARAEARGAAKEEAEKALQQEAASREELRQQRESLFAVLVPLATAASAAWVGLLALANVRDRRTEIGLLRALGLRSMQILSIFMGKAMMIGLAGAVIGYVGGYLLGAAAGQTWDKAVAGAENLNVAWSPTLLVCVMIAAPLLAALASWLPAVAASQQDPAVVLREE